MPTAVEARCKARSVESGIRPECRFNRGGHEATDRRRYIQEDLLFMKARAVQETLRSTRNCRSVLGRHNISKNMTECKTHHAIGSALPSYRDVGVQSRKVIRKRDFFSPNLGVDL